jgi:hypothetical protein
MTVLASGRWSGTRTESGWEFITIEPPADAVVLKALGATLSLEAIYENSGR